MSVISERSEKIESSHCTTNGANPYCGDRDSTAPSRPANVPVGHAQAKRPKGRKQPVPGFVAYYRVSTAKQSRKRPVRRIIGTRTLAPTGHADDPARETEQMGLGLGSQQDIVRGHADAAGKPILAEFIEVETATKKTAENRPKLAEALALCKATGATLIIAKLDRLARNVSFLSGLMESGVDFVACDNPSANRMVIHILAAVAEGEARMISERTKAALAEYVRRGGVLGNPDNLTDEDRRKGREVMIRKRIKEARIDYADIEPDIMRWAGQGWTYKAIADRLNQDGRKTRGNALWTPTQVHRVIRRAVKEGGFTLPARPRGRRPKDS